MGSNSGSYPNYLYAINPNGSLKWKFTTGGWICSSPTIGSDGTIYVGSGDHYLYAINPDGTLKWKFKTGNSIYSSVAIAQDGTIFVGSDDNYLYAINSSSKGLANSPWPKYNHDNQNTGNFLYSSGPIRESKNLCENEIIGTPSEPLKAIECKFGVPQPNPTDTIVKIPGGKNVLIQPKLKVDSVDIGKQATLLMYIYIPAFQKGFLLPSYSKVLESIEIFKHFSNPLDLSKATGLVFDLYFGYQIGNVVKYNVYEGKIVECQ